MKPTYVLCPAVLILAVLTGRAAGLDEDKLLDLTHTFDEKTIHWPTAKPFTWNKDAWGKGPGGYWYASASFSASEHLGTHIDSPIHFAEGQAGTDVLPLRKLTGPAIVIDVSAYAEKIVTTSFPQMTSPVGKRLTGGFHRELSFWCERDGLPCGRIHCAIWERPPQETRRTYISRALPLTRQRFSWNEKSTASA